MADDNLERKLPPHLFKPGQSGNPKGRPKGAMELTTTLLKVLPREIPDVEHVATIIGVPAEILQRLTGKSNPTWYEVLTLAALLQACAGNGKIMKEIWDRIEGKIKNPTPDPVDGMSGIFVLPGGKNGDSK